MPSVKAFAAFNRSSEGKGGGDGAAASVAAKASSNADAGSLNQRSDL